MQTRQAFSQLMLVREQLISETNARIEAQVFNLFFYFLFSTNNIFFYYTLGENTTITPTES